MKVTADEISALHPCWDADGVHRVVGRGLTYYQIAKRHAVEQYERGAVAA